MAHTYTYSVAVDFPGGVSLPCLRQEIEASAIVTPLVTINIAVGVEDEDVLDIIFASTLTPGEKIILDANLSPGGGLIAAHNPNCTIIETEDLEHSGASGFSGICCGSGGSGGFGFSGLSGFSGYSGDSGPSVHLDTRDPNQNDDSLDGYEPGDWWINTNTGEAFVLIDDTAGNAVWDSTEGASGTSGFSGFSGRHGPSVHLDTSDPDQNDDSLDGYEPGDWWINTNTGEVFVLIDGTPGNAVWESVGGASGASGVSGFSGTFSGASGSSGISGASGLSGFSGTFSGASGQSGYSGLIGASGISGFSGLGFSGPSGPSGPSGASGTSGYSGVGLLGLSGTSGYSGLGLSGLSGSSGQIGASGTSGYSGVGLPGPSGTSGYSGVGSSGPSGPSGPSGSSGTSGYSGAGLPGPSGISGISGYSGVGFSGPSGPSGPSGSSGYSGLSGFSGTYSGSSGYSGSKGETGLAGPSGTSGLSGFRGESGPSGTSGYSGESGAKGDQGVSGPSGPSGPSGYSGSSGPQGLSGQSGYSGLSGTKGEQGVSGPSGPSGPSGSSGYSGAGGSGPSGWSGTSGARGLQGISGFSATGSSSVIDIYDDAGGKTIYATWTFIPFAKERQKDSIYTHSNVTNPQWVTITKSGRYRITARSSIDQVTGGIGPSYLSSSESRISFNDGTGWTDVDGTSGFGYHGDLTTGENTATMVAIVSLHAGDLVAVQARQISGIGVVTLKTIQDGSSLTIEWADTVGYEGPSGLSGSIGTSGYSGTSGLSGTSGSSGLSGFTGISGFSGKPGTGLVEIQMENTRDSFIRSISGFSSATRLDIGRFWAVNLPEGSNSAIDFSIELPEGLDDTKDIVANFVYHVNSSSAGNIKLRMEWEVVDVNEDTTPASPTGFVETTIIAPGTAELKEEFNLTVPESDISSSTESLRFSLIRLGTNVGDTFAGAIRIESICFRLYATGGAGEIEASEASGPSGTSGYSGQAGSQGISGTSGYSGQAGQPGCMGPS